MKAKLKSANKFTRFMLAHGEKLGMAAVVAIAGLLIYSSLGRERLAADQQPANLQEKATQANQHVAQMDWANFPETEKLNADVVEIKFDPTAPVIDPNA